MGHHDKCKCKHHGATGPTGPTGPTGATGATGAAGSLGSTAVYLTSSDPPATTAATTYTAVLGSVSFVPQGTTAYFEYDIAGGGSGATSYEVDIYVNINGTGVAGANVPAVATTAGNVIWNSSRAFPWAVTAGATNTATLEWRVGASGNSASVDLGNHPLTHCAILAVQY